MNTRTRWRLLIALVAIAVLAAACGAADPVEIPDEADPVEVPVFVDGAANEDAESADVSDDQLEADELADDEAALEIVEVPPAEPVPATAGGEEGCELTYEIVAAAPRTAPSPLLTLGLENGFFAANCLDVTLEEGLTSRETITGVAANVINLGVVGLVPAISAVANSNAPIHILGVADAAAAPANDFVVLVASADSGITGFADLADARVGIRSPNSLCAIALQAAITGAGIDLESIKFERGTSGELRQLLKRARIDATCEAYPAVDRLIEEGGVAFGGITEVFNIDVPYSVITSNSDWATVNAQAVQHFKDAMQQTADWANEDELRFRSLLPGASRLTAEQAGETILPFQVGAGDPSLFDFEPIFAALRATGVIAEDADLTNLFG